MCSCLALAPFDSGVRFRGYLMPLALSWVWTGWIPNALWSVCGLPSYGCFKSAFDRLPEPSSWDTHFADFAGVGAKSVAHHRRRTARIRDCSDAKPLSKVLIANHGANYPSRITAQCYFSHPKGRTAQKCPASEKKIGRQIRSSLLFFRLVNLIEPKVSLSSMNMR